MFIIVFYLKPYLKAAMLTCCRSAADRAIGEASVAA
jgi:hypothetical protein